MMLSEFQNKTMWNSVRYLGYITEADTVRFSEYNIENSKLGGHLYAALYVWSLGLSTLKSSQDICDRGGRWQNAISALNT